MRPKPCVLALNGTLRNIAARKLGLDWSPEQVAAWLKLQYRDDERMRVSHETIYRSRHTGEYPNFPFFAFCHRRGNTSSLPRNRDLKSLILAARLTSS